MTAPSNPAPKSTRCAVHPGRTRYDDCPTCGRARCVDDARRFGDRGCNACISESTAVRASAFDLVVRAGLAAMPVALVGGWIAAEYVEVHLFSWLFPMLVGLAATAVAGLASYRRGLDTVPVTIIGAVAGLLGTALGFRLYPHGPDDPLTPWSEVWFPYLCSVIGAGLWSVLLRPANRGPEG